MAFKEVYKAGNGWVRQFKDGTVLGPFGSKHEAMSAAKPEEKKVAKPKQEIIKEDKEVSYEDEETGVKTFGTKRIK